MGVGISPGASSALRVGPSGEGGLSWALQPEAPQLPAGVLGTGVRPLFSAPSLAPPGKPRPAFLRVGREREARLPQPCRRSGSGARTAARAR